MPQQNDMAADLAGHHIEGYARAALEAGRDGAFAVPLVSPITDTLYMGGCIGGVRLTDDFTFVLSLYPWEQYELGPSTTRVEARLYDSADMPPADELETLAALVNHKLGEPNAKVLVHCQAGLNRSGLITALALIRRGLHPTDAIALLREKRHPVVLCNQTFEQWLLALDTVYCRCRAAGATPGPDVRCVNARPDGCHLEAEGKA